MKQLGELPVVLGSSLSGLLVSLSLSRTGIEHVILGGDEPPEVPRLGESLNECAGPELWRLFGGELAEFFYTKSHISLFNGDLATMAHLANPNRDIESLKRFAARNGERARATWSKTLLHVDRVGFDRAVYHKVRSQESCHFVNSLATQLDYDPDEDVFVRIKLQDNRSIERPRYLFDATGPRGVAADRAGVKTIPISRLQRVVWTHHLRQSDDSPQREWWEYGTNLLRLFHDTDGLDGIAWLIPLGRSLSLGISVDAEKYGDAVMHNQEILDRLDNAFARRGMEYRRTFSKSRPIQDLTHKYFVRDRAYGKNWLLVGGTFIQVWFPSSAGLWTTIAAAGMAPDLIQRPLQLGARYEAMMRKLSTFHEVLDDMICGEPFGNQQDAYRFWASWLATIPSRLSDYLRITHGQIDAKRLRYWLYDTATPLFRRFPRLQLLCWGFVVARIKKNPELAEQAGAFPDYLHTTYFRLVNYLKGLSYVVRSLMPGQKN